ncbi:FadR/GntR family transcriptional regulator [Phycicoccus flavus]|uniref:FadR/GntR family transcriptional regulator n=1 Tax=Phycicoccus flavus TaxID=2502783 RepID=UPI001F2C91EB|nr:FadR/GntR family transcriptional regulator [Phycicoccus flavus]
MTSSLHHRVLDRLGAELTGGAVPAGSTFSTESLMERYGVSRTIAREALKVLEQNGVVTSRRRVGVTVMPESEWAALSPLVVRWWLESPQRPRQLRELSELRGGVEPVAAGLAATRATDDQRSAISAAVMGMSRTGPRGDLETYLQHDIAFHRTVLEASGNAGLASFAPLVAEALSGRTHHDLMPPVPEPQAIRWHFAVAEAIALGDAAEAERVMRAIVGEAQEAMEQVTGDSRD